MEPIDSPVHDGTIAAEHHPDRPASYNDKGILEVLDIIRRIEAAGVPCCIAGGHALKYYGVPRLSGAWIICVPTEKFDEVCAMFSREPLSQTFEPAEQILPLVCSLLHAYPHLKMKGVRFSLFVAPSSEYFVSGFGPDKFERSRFQVPYPKLEYFVQGMMDTQNWVGVQELVDGMDLTEEWGEGWLDLDKPGEVEYAKSKNERILGSMSKFPEAIPTSLSEGPIDLRARWQRIVRGKERRIDILAPKGKYITKYRKTGSQDPRLKESRVC